MDDKEEESVISASSKRFKQQKLRACRPFLTPWQSAIIYAVLGLVCMSVALAYNLMVDSMFEVKIPYTGSGVVPFTAAQNFTGQLFIYYEIDGVRQNHFLYSPSLNWPQLRGQPYATEADLASCRPLTKSDRGLIVPCGAVAGSVFNDTFVFSSNFPNITRTGIALPAFRDLFAAPDNGSYGAEDQWLGEGEYATLFPDGQTDERFINWMRIAAFSPFRKLWAKSATIAELIKGEMYSVTIESNFPVMQFEGTKKIVIADVSWVGGKNSFFQVFFYVLMGLSFAAAFACALAAWRNWFPLYRQIAKGQLKMPDRSAVTESLIGAVNP
jgi:hypothetical protein